MVKSGNCIQTVTHTVGDAFLFWQFSLFWRIPFLCICLPFVSWRILFTLAETEKKSMSLPLMLPGRHPWDQSLLGDGKCVTEFAPHFKSCAGKAARHPVRNIRLSSVDHRLSHHCSRSAIDDFTGIQTFIYRKIFETITSSIVNKSCKLQTKDRDRK